MTKRSSLYHSKTGQMGPIFKMASENRTVQKQDKFFRFSNGIRKQDHSTTGQKLPFENRTGLDFGMLTVHQSLQILSSTCKKI